VRNEIEYSVCTTTTAIAALATSGNNSSETHDHFRADFDRRFRRLLAGAAVVDVSAAIIENFGRLPAALLATTVGELLLRRLLVGAVVIETGAAVIENCEQLPAVLLATAVGELLLCRLLAGPVVTDTGAAVIENCEVPDAFLMTPVAETCFDQITTARSHCPGKAASPGALRKRFLIELFQQVGSQAGVLGAAYGGSR
jgi:hypothetical protein